MKSFLVAAFTLLSSWFFSIEGQCDQYKNRKNVVENILKQYERTVTLLDMSSDYVFDMYFARRFDTVCVLSNVKTEKNCLVDLQKKDSKGNIIVLGDIASLDDVRMFGQCEHFDITLAFDFLVSCGDDWECFLDELLCYGDYLLVAVPTDLIDIYNQHIKQKGDVLVSEDEVEHIFLFYCDKKFLHRTNWNHDSSTGQDTYIINSSFIEKTLTKKKTHNFKSVTTDWYPGINLCTFSNLNGIYPLKSSIFQMLEPFEFIQHNDLFDFNIIIQGHSLVPIDGDDPTLMNNPQGDIKTLLSQFE